MVASFQKNTTLLVIRQASIVLCSILYRYVLLQCETNAYQVRGKGQGGWWGPARIDGAKFIQLKLDNWSHLLQIMYLLFI